MWTPIIFRPTLVARNVWAHDLAPTMVVQNILLIIWIYLWRKSERCFVYLERKGKGTSKSKGFRSNTTLDFSDTLSIDVRNWEEGICMPWSMLTATGVSCARRWCQACMERKSYCIFSFRARTCKYPLLNISKSYIEVVTLGNVHEQLVPTSLTSSPIPPLDISRKQLDFDRNLIGTQLWWG